MPWRTQPSAMAHCRMPWHMCNHAMAHTNPTANKPPHRISEPSRSTKTHLPCASALRHAGPGVVLPHYTCREYPPSHPRGFKLPSQALKILKRHRTLICPFTAEVTYHRARHHVTRCQNRTRHLVTGARIHLTAPDKPGTMLHEPRAIIPRGPARHRVTRCQGRPGTYQAPCYKIPSHRSPSSMHHPPLYLQRIPPLPSPRVQTTQPGTQNLAVPGTMLHRARYVCG